MTRILSTAQKKTIFQAIPSSFTIDTVAFTASKKYSNQLVINDSTVFPIISLNYSQDGLKGISEAGVGGVFWKALLTIHILAKPASGLNGATIAEGIAQGIVDVVKTWTTALSGGIQIFHPDVDIHAIESKGLVPDIAGVHDYVFWIDLWHT